jgi:hypothetical protein
MRRWAMERARYSSIGRTSKRGRPGFTRRTASRTTLASGSFPLAPSGKEDVSGGGLAEGDVELCPRLLVHSPAGNGPHDSDDLGPAAGAEADPLANGVAAGPVALREAGIHHRDRGGLLHLPGREVPSPE